MTQNIDLLRFERAKAKPQAATRLPLAAWAIVAAVLALTVHAAIESRASAVQRQSLAQLQSDAQRVQRIIAAVGAVPAGRDVLAAEHTDVAALEALAVQMRSAVPGRSEPFTEPLRALARARVPGLWLTGIRLHAGGITLEGGALDAARVPELLAALREEPRFAGTAFARIELQPARTDAATQPDAVRFRVASEEPVAPPGGAAR